MSNLIKAALSFIIVGVILYKVDFAIVWQTILSANPWILLAALFFQLLSLVVAAYRWTLIMQLLAFKHDFAFYLKSYFKGALFNQVLPTSIGGDAYRVMEVASHGGLAKEAFYGVFIDRIVGLVGLLILNFLANLFEYDLLPPEIFYGISFISLAAILGLFILMALHKFPILERYKATRLFFELSHRFRFIYKTPARIFQQVGLSMLIHFFSIFAIFSIGHSVGINEAINVFLILVPPALLLTLLPISFAGWGVREGALVGLFLLIDIPQEQVLAMSLLYGIILILSSLPGLYFYLKSKHTYL